MLISCEDLVRTFSIGGQDVTALDSVSMNLDEGEYVRIIGASGSGKTTLLNLIAGMDTPTSGSIKTPLGSLDRMTRKELASWRANRIGMVFQSFNLVNHYTALQNVELGMLFTGIEAKERGEKAIEILDYLGLKERINHKPSALSGGEQQRVALARALVKKPQILLADEPTGNLDANTTSEISDYLKHLNDEGLTILLVTHDLELAQNDVNREIVMNYGNIVTEKIVRN